jgi:outer membrane protein assembly factor BamB
MGLTLVVVISCTMLVSSAAVPGARLVEVATLDASTIISQRVAGTRLFVLVPNATAQLMAVRLADGGKLWQASIAVNLRAADIDVVDDTVLVIGDTSAGGVGIQAFDAATGRQLWRSDLPRLPGVRMPGTVLVAAPLDQDGRPVPSRQGPGIDASSPLPLLLRALDVRTGRPVWSYQAPAGWWIVLDYDAAGVERADRFVVVAPGGKASAVDLASGRVTATAVIPVDPGGPPDSNQLAQLAVFGDQFLVGYLSQGQPTLTAYRTHTLTPQWTTSVATLDLALTPCAPLLCFDDAGHGIQAVAPTTGAVVWTGTDPGWYGAVDQWLYNTPQLFQSGPTRLIAPATGRTVLDLGRWRLAAQDPGQRPLFELVEHSGRIWLGILAPGPRIQPLGTVADLPEVIPPQGPLPCDVSTGFLACMTIHHQLRIWHFQT